MKNIKNWRKHREVMISKIKPVLQPLLFKELKSARKSGELKRLGFDKVVSNFRFRAIYKFLSARKFTTKSQMVNATETAQR